LSVLLKSASSLTLKVDANSFPEVLCDRLLPLDIGKVHVDRTQLKQQEPYTYPPSPQSTVIIPSLLNHTKNLVWIGQCALVVRL
jgi:hypothetical protein